MSNVRPEETQGHGDGQLPNQSAAVIDPRAVRVSPAPASRVEGDPTMTLSPSPSDVLRPVEHLAGRAILGGVATPVGSPGGSDGGNGRSAPTGDSATGVGASDAAAGSAAAVVSAGFLLDGAPLDARLVPLDQEHTLLIEGPDAPDGVVSRVILGAERRREEDGAVLREVVVDGWRFDVEVESERRASLRERARRGREVAAKSGPIEIQAIIPGRIVALSVTVGDAVTAGQQLLVLEAMKMQNELRAPREGSIERIAVAVGENVEVGDLLMVIT